MTDTTNWSKGDRHFAETLKEIMQKGTFDENPRPIWEDTKEPAHSIQIFQKFEDYGNEIPLNNFRNTAMKMGIQEMFWIYQDQTSNLYKLKERGIDWWESWNIGDGTIGFRYGQTVYRYNLMEKLISGLQKDPFSRRHIISLWQETDFYQSKGLNPCAYETIWGVSRDADRNLVLNMTLVQRSNDYLVAGYINKFQYWGLLQMVARSLGYMPGTFCHYTHNVHIYDRHMNAARELSLRVNSFYPVQENNQSAIFHGKEGGHDAYGTFMDYNIRDWEFKTHHKRDIVSKLPVAV